MKFIIRFKTIFLPVIGLLALALFIQNTCPRGFAGKSTVAASLFPLLAESIAYTADVRF